MNIAFIIQNYNYHGGGQVTASLVEYFQSLGHKVNIIVIRCDKGDFESRPIHFSNTIDLNASGLFSAIIKLIKIFRHSQYDAYVSMGGYSNLAAGLAKLFGGSSTPIIGSEHFAKSVLMGDYAKPFLRLTLPLFRLAYTQINGLIFVSERLRLEFLKKNSWHPSRCITIYNPIRLLENKIKQNIEHKDESGIIFLGIGVLEQRKRFDLLLESFSIIANTRDKLLLAGTGSLKNELEILAKKLEIESQVHFLGYVKDINSLMKKSDILVSTSNSEAFGMVLAEGLAAGLQVVSTNSFSGPAEVLENGRYGFLAEVDNVGSIVSSMRAAVNTPISQEILKEGASRFLLESIVNKYLKFIEAIIKSDGKLYDPM